LIDDERAILETVEAVLGPSGLLDVGTGVLRSCSDLAETLDHTLIPDYRVEYAVKSARLVRADETSATVELDATVETITTGDGFERRTKAHAQGPVQLVREGESWKVADMIVDGVSLRSSFFQNGVSGSAGGLGVTVLGGRAFPAHVWAYIELANELERPVKIESVTLGHRRSLLPGWRWATARLPVDMVEPGCSRVDVVASLADVHAAAGIRLLLKADVGLVDARPPSARSRRFVPLAVRYPWAWSTTLVTTIVVAAGALFGWWIASLVLIQLAALTLFSFEGYLRRGVGRATLIRFGWTLAGLTVGVALFFANGGFGGFRGESEHERVTKYVERVTGAGVVEARKVFEADVGHCPYRVWDVHARRGRWWVVATKGVLPLTPYEHRLYAEPAKVIAVRRALAERLPGSC
jgi:hypothetical protein